MPLVGRPSIRLHLLVVMLNSVRTFNPYKTLCNALYNHPGQALYLVCKPLYMQGQSNVDLSPLPGQMCLLEYPLLVQVGSPK